MSARWIYFIRPVGAEGPVKIGCSRVPQGRVEQYAIWSPFPLEIAARIEGGFALESRFHTAFRHLHSHHEWFRSSPELSETIARIRAGSFDQAGLPQAPKGHALPRREVTPEHSKANKVLRAAVQAHLNRFQCHWPQDARWAAEALSGPARDQALAILNGYLEQAA